MPKKVFMSVDMEGITGIVSGEQTGGDPGEYATGRRLMVGDVNAAIDGLVKAGVEEIIVCDGHGGMKNIQPEEINEAAYLVRGSPKPFSQMCGISSEFDAVYFVGYHARMGLPKAILCHTYSGATVQSLHINGVEVGETGLNAALAGFYGVPTIFISGDLAVTEEAKAIIPEITTAPVKWAVGRVAAKCLHPKKARQLITTKAEEAWKNMNKVKPYVFKPPIEVKLKLFNPTMTDAVATLPYVEVLDGLTVKIVYDNYPAAYNATLAAIGAAGTTVVRR